MNLYRITDNLRRTKYPQIWVGIGLLFLFLFCSLFYLFVFVINTEIRAVPISMHSVLAADYSSDPRGVQQPIIQLGIIEDIFNDTGDGNGGIATIKAILSTPITTLTPGLLPTNANDVPTPTQNQIPRTNIPTLSPTVNGNGTPVPTTTRVPPGGTQNMTAAPSSTMNSTAPAGTHTPRWTASSTPRSNPSSTPTPTIIPPSSTHTPSPTPAWTPTRTSNPTRTPNPYPYP